MNVYNNSFIINMESKPNPLESGCPVCKEDFDGTELELECFHIVHHRCRLEKCPICFRSIAPSVPPFIEGRKKAEPISFEAQRIIMSLNRGRNVIMQGPGGTGKSYTIGHLKRYYSEKNVRIYVTALTGVASLAIGGKTLHSWSGHGLLDKPFENYTRVQNGSRNPSIILGTDILVIDECSMLNADTFDLLNKLCKYYRRSEDFFGGIKTIFCGDIMQLSPVKGKMFMFSDGFSVNDFDVHTFYSPKRYPDADFFSLLMRIRRNEMTPQDIKLLEGKAKSFSPTTIATMEVKPTVLRSKNADVEAENARELQKLSTPSFIYKARDSYPSSDKENSIKLLDLMAKREVTLKVGAQVMHTVNSPIFGLVNGSRGVVINLSKEEVTVRYHDGLVHAHIRHNFSHRISKSVTIVRQQFPFILSWCTTIHKSQGSTMDCVVCDLGESVFADSQAYVALSRVKSLEGLHISSFYPKSIKCSKTHLEMLDKLEEKSLPIVVFPE